MRWRPAGCTRGTPHSSTDTPLIGLQGMRGPGGCLLGVGSVYSTVGCQSLR